jgi:antitoxin YokJ
MAIGNVNELVELARATPDCVVHPVAGIPSLPPGVELPADLLGFYRKCGGLEFFQSSDYPISIAPPDRFRPTNLAVLGEAVLDDRSDRWFTIGITPDREYLSIDLDPARLGCCYDSFHEIHGLVGESAVVAISFTDLLARLFGNAGRHWYWLQPDFESLGDAYDE